MSDFPISIAPGDSDAPPQLPIELPDSPSTPGVSLPGQVPSGQAALNAYQLALMGADGAPPFVGTLSQWLLSLQGSPVQMRTWEGYLQWKLEESTAWISLLALLDLKGEQGPAPYIYRGAYNNGEDYTVGDAVTFQGSLWYRVLPPNPGYPPGPGNSYWTLLLEKGETGATGASAYCIGVFESVAALLAAWPDGPGLQNLHYWAFAMDVSDSAKLWLYRPDPLNGGNWARELITLPVVPPDSDVTLGGASPSDAVAPSQAAVKSFVGAAITNAGAAYEPKIEPGTIALSKLATDPLARANHTGTQPQSTVVNLTSDLASKAPKVSPEFAGMPLAPTAGSADDSTKIATTAFVQSVVRSLVGLAPAELDTLAEIAAALALNQTSDAALTEAVSQKLSKSLNLLDLSDVAQARVNLGLVIGTNVAAPNQNTTGNAGTATRLETARNINGVSFDGSNSITVTAAAGTLTGPSLALTITSAPGLVSAAGGTFGSAAFTAASSYEVPLSFSGALSRVGNTVTIPTGGVSNSMLATNPLARANHTGTQPASSITGLGTAAALNAGTAAGDVPALSAVGTLPALSGQNLTNLQASRIEGQIPADHMLEAIAFSVAMA